MRTPNKNNKKVVKSMNKIVQKIPRIVKRVFSPKTSPSSNRSSFSSALCNPFAPTSIGCRVPDPYSFPTSAFHSRGNTVLKSNASGTTGILCLPNPVFSLIDLGTSSGSGAAVSSTGMNNFGGTANLTYGATSQANLLTVGNGFRLVSWGVKISNLQPELSAVGKLYYAMVPTASDVPSIGMLGTPVTASAITAILTGSNASTLYSSLIENLPSGQQLVVQDLLHGDLQLSGQYTDPSFFKFRTLIDTVGYNATTYFGTEVLQSTAGGTIVSTNNEQVVNMGGGVGIIIYGDGFPGSINVLDVEYIYHYEVTPYAGNSSAIASSDSNVLVGSMLEVERGVAEVARTGGASWIDRGMSFLNTSVDLYGRYRGSYDKYNSVGMRNNLPRLTNY